MSKPSRVLIVDDDEALCRTLANLFDGEGFVVDVAHDGTEAIDRARDHVPTAVILDLQMPNLDGYGFIDLLRHIPGCTEVPVIVITAVRELMGARQRMEGKGVVLLMPKPFDIEALLAAVAAVRRRSA